jgi:hypothetical protein
MRRRYQTGGIKKQRGRWTGMWWVDGSRKSRVLGLVKEMTKSAAREAVNTIVAAENAKRETNRPWKFGEFIEQVYFPYYGRKWKDSTRENSVNCVTVHRVAQFKDRELASFRRDELQTFLIRKRWAFVLGRRSSAVGHQACVRYGRGRGPCRAQPGAVAVHAEGCAKTRPPGDDAEGGANLLWRPRSAGTADRQARGHCRDASRQNLRPHLGPVDGNLCRYPATGVPGKNQHAQNR